MEWLLFTALGIITAVQGILICAVDSSNHRLRKRIEAIERQVFK